METALQVNNLLVLLVLRVLPVLLVLLILVVLLVLLPCRSICNAVETVVFSLAEGKQIQYFNNI